MINAEDTKKDKEIILVVQMDLLPPIHFLN